MPELQRQLAIYRAIYLHSVFYSIEEEVFTMKQILSLDDTDIKMLIGKLGPRKSFSIGVEVRVLVL